MLFQYLYHYNCEVLQSRILSYKNMKASFIIFPDWLFFSFMNKYNKKKKITNCFFAFILVMAVLDLQITWRGYFLLCVCGWPSVTTEDLFWPRKNPVKGTSVMVLKMERALYIHSPTYNTCRPETRTCNLSITNLSLLPLGHDFPDNQRSLAYITKDAKKPMNHLQ